MIELNYISCTIPDDLSNHHNGSNQELVCVGLYEGLTYQDLKDTLIHDVGLLNTVPVGIPDSEIYKAIETTFDTAFTESDFINEIDGINLVGNEDLDIYFYFYYTW